MKSVPPAIEHRRLNRNQSAHGRRKASAGAVWLTMGISYGQRTIRSLRMSAPAGESGEAMNEVAEREN